MTGLDHEHIFIVDDEPRICKEVSEHLENLGLRINCFTNAFDCIKEFSSHRCDLLITALKIPGIDGLELLREAKHLQPWLSVLIITGYGDIQTAVTAIKAGAVDFLEKPLETETFFHKIKSILRQNREINNLMNRSLTKMEIKVLKLIVKGHSSKEIAYILNRSRRTVETHRTNVMKKLGVNTFIDLIKQASLIGLIKLSKNHRVV